MSNPQSSQPAHANGDTHVDGHGKSGLRTMVLGAIGVVFGDIGTSPLYTLKEAFRPHFGLVGNHDTILGILSLVFWALMIVVTLKYVTIIMRADNEGEGGIMALEHAEAIESRHRQIQRHRIGPLALAQLERLVAVARAADDVDAGALQRARDDAAHQRVVVGNDDAGRTDDGRVRHASAQAAAGSSGAENAALGCSSTIRRSPTLAIASTTDGSVPGAA